MITPSLDQGPFIERTIRSVLGQGYPELEYVIVDGGSTDGTLDVIRHYEDRLAWWVSEADSGQANAINKGIERTSGEIVAFLNSDDYFLPGAFARAMEALRSSPRQWVSGAAVNVLEGDPPEQVGVWRPEPPEAIEGRPGGRQWWLLEPWHVPQPSCFWRRELFERHGPFREDMHYAFDAEFMVRLAIAGEEPELLPEDVLSARVEHPEQKSQRPLKWGPEFRRITALHRAGLAPQERRRLNLLRAPVALRHFVRAAVVVPALRAGGRLLEALPDRIRPRIRSRDRAVRTDDFRPADLS